MKLSASQGISNQETLDKLKRQTQIFAQATEDVVNGQITFQDNFRCQIITVTFVNPNVDVQVPHQLGTVPIGYLAINKTSPLDVYNGSANVFTKTFITVRSDAGGTANILIF